MPDSSLLIIVAHPDDETIGAGALISRTPCVKIVHVTDGAPVNMADALAAGFNTRAAYATARRAEALRALGQAGVREDCIVNLGLTDQNVAFCLVELTAKILALLHQDAPGMLLTHAYEGGHPDHDATAFAGRMAYRRYQENSGACVLFEFAGYNGQDGGLRRHEFLPHADIPQYRLRLTSREQELKTRMLRAYTSQAKTLEGFLSPENEIFRRAPEYDFTRPPHGGRLFYENFEWGVDGHDWRELAREALQELGCEEERREPHRA